MPVLARRTRKRRTLKTGPGLWRSLVFFLQDVGVSCRQGVGSISCSWGEDFGTAYLEDQVELLGEFGVLLSNPLGLPLQMRWSARVSNRCFQTMRESERKMDRAVGLPGWMASILGRVPVFPDCLLEPMALFAPVATKAECLEVGSFAGCLSREGSLADAVPADGCGMGGAPAGFCLDDRSLGDTGGLGEDFDALPFVSFDETGSGEG